MFVIFDTNETNKVLNDLFKSLKTLSHLNLADIQINDQFFDAIDKYSKNLQYLELYFVEIITDSTIDSWLPKINPSKLQTLYLVSYKSKEYMEELNFKKMEKIAEKILPKILKIKCD